MVFNSFEFLIFFVIVTSIFFVINYKLRNNFISQIFLLCSSLFFYMRWNPVYVILMIISITITWISGLLMEGRSKKQKKIVLCFSLISNLLILFFFKYYNFFANSTGTFLSIFSEPVSLPKLDILLPVGISFYTFQALGYSIDVYRETVKAERNYLTYAIFVTFFPQLVAGPIERTGNLLPQFKTCPQFDYQRITFGLKLAVWGLFKKVVIADRIALAVSTVYGNPAEYEGLAFIVATVFFAIQIYCDFSGYSDIAIGIAQVLGYKLMDNFKRPYHSKTISEFWKRWHISLSTWFKDYLYISLGGNRVTKWRWQFNLFITFLVSGLWHGANWTYVIWGALNGFYLVFAIWTKSIRESISRSIGLAAHPKIQKLWQISATFSLICFAWIFFRASNLSNAWYIITHLFSGMLNIIHVQYLKETLLGMGLSKIDFIIAVFSILLMESIHLLQRKTSISAMLQNKPVLYRWTLYYTSILFIIFFGIFESNTFIYFQF